MPDQESRYVYVIGCRNPNATDYLGYLSEAYKPEKFSEPKNAKQYNTMDDLIRAMRKAAPVGGSPYKYFIEKFYIRKVTIDEFTSVGDVS